jgi:hypothetical protein
MNYQFLGHREGNIRNVFEETNLGRMHLKKDRGSGPLVLVTVAFQFENLQCRYG